MLSILPALMLGGCINEAEDCPQGGGTGDEGTLNLQFSIVTRKSASADNTFQSRAADIAGDVIGSFAENFIAMSDLRFMLFDGNRRFLQTLPATVKNVYTSPDYSVYIFHAPVDEPYFDQNINTTFSFYILALANAQSLGMAYPEPASGATLEEVFASAQGETGLLTAKLIPSLLIASNLVAEGQRFPMAGLQRFTVDGDRLLKSTEAVPYDLSAGGKNINMLRAIAKIEVVDRVRVNGQFTDEDENGENSRLRIDKVQIDGIFNAGSLLPSITEWTNGDADETQQVDDPSVPAGAKYQNPVSLLPDGSLSASPSSEGAVIHFVPDKYARQLRADNCPVFSCYLYEYDRSRITNSEQAPYMRVTTRGSAGLQDGESLVRPIRLATYTNGVADQNLQALLRNHIYRYEVIDVNEFSEIELVWTVCPMDEATVDIPSFN